MMKLIDKLTWTRLLIIALMLGLAPFIPEPHLVEKLRMLFSGTLTKPLDIFDLLLHCAPLVLIIIKGIGQYKRKQKQ